MNDCDCEFSMWLEEANSSEMTGALISYRNELEDALDRIKQLELMVRDMKAYSFQTITDDESDCSCENHIVCEQDENEGGWTKTMDMVEGKCYWVEDGEMKSKCDCCDHQC